MPRRFFARRRSIAAFVAAFSVLLSAFALSGCDDDDGEGSQHNTCFYRCNFDEDCARGQRCEHDRTVCEYP
jgi:hypothetical protein